MRTIEYSGRFKRDYRREKSSALGGRIDRLLTEALALLDFRDCHIRPDLVLIYRKPDSETLELVRLGSHNELGL